MQHREVVGGLWEELGLLQLNFLRARGLRPASNLLDIGCGCLRGGVKFVEYLEAGHYFGVDACRSLLDAGYEIELRALGLQAKVPRANLRCSAAFEFEGFPSFEFAVAQSLFTHLPLNLIRLCLDSLARVMLARGRLFATYFDCPESDPFDLPILHEPGRVTTYAWRDPYHYRISDFEFAIRGLPWIMRIVGPWDHPRDQQMLIFERSV
jgi:SAM-dependent methyltransferase